MIPRASTIAGRGVDNRMRNIGSHGILKLVEQLAINNHFMDIKEVEGTQFVRTTPKKRSAQLGASRAGSGVGSRDVSP